jgi:hypothetical protein
MPACHDTAGLCRPEPSTDGPSWPLRATVGMLCQ